MAAAGALLLELAAAVTWGAVEEVAAAEDVCTAAVEEVGATVDSATVWVSVTGERDVLVLEATDSDDSVIAGLVTVTQTVVGIIVTINDVEVQTLSTVSPPIVFVSVTAHREVIVLETRDSVLWVTAGPVTVFQAVVGTIVTIVEVEVDVISTVFPPIVVVSTTGQSEVIVV